MALLYFTQYLPGRSGPGQSLLIYQQRIAALIHRIRLKKKRDRKGGVNTLRQNSNFKQSGTEFNIKTHRISWTANFIDQTASY